jgi:hypothetical protein
VIAVSSSRKHRENMFMAPEFIPLCPVHGCDMIAYKSRKLLTYFRCPQSACDCTDRSARKLFSAVSARLKYDTSAGTPPAS